MPDSSDAVMPGRSKLAGVYISRQSSFSRKPGIQFRRMAKAAPTPFATMSSRRSDACRKPVHGLAQPHDAEGDERPRDRGTCRIGCVGPDPVVRMSAMTRSSRSGRSCPSRHAACSSRPSLLDEFEFGAAPIPVPEPDRDEAGADGGEFPSHGGEMIAQLAQRIKRRRGRGQILVARAGRWRRSSPRHTRSALLRFWRGCLQRLGRLRKRRSALATYGISLSWDDTRCRSMLTAETNPSRVEV